VPIGRRSANELHGASVTDGGRSKQVSQWNSLLVLAACAAKDDR